MTGQDARDVMAEALSPGDARALADAGLVSQV